MAGVGALLLISVFWICRRKPKDYVVFMVTVAYLANWAIADSALDLYLNDILGYYVSQSAFEVLVVLMLIQKPMIESVLIMLLCLVAVLFNIIGFTLDLLNHPIDDQINYIMWGLFAAQLLILFSTRIANGLYRNITKLNLVRNFCRHNLKINTKGLL